MGETESVTIKSGTMVESQEELQHLGAIIRAMMEKMARTVSYSLNNVNRLQALCRQINEGEPLGKPEDVLKKIKQERDELRELVNGG